MSLPTTAVSMGRMIFHRREGMAGGEAWDPGLSGLLVRRAVPDSDRPPFLSLVGPIEAVQHTSCQMESVPLTIQVRGNLSSCKCQQQC